jgi:membrane-associated phospholipid phosphatase
MKISAFLGSFWVLCSSVLAGTPNDPLRNVSVDQSIFGQRIGFMSGSLTILRTPLLLNPDQLPSGTNTSILFDRPTNPQTPDQSQNRDFPIEQSSSVLKPTLFAGGALAITAALIRTDQKTYNVIHGWKTANDPIEDVSPVITNLGDGRASVAIFGGFLAYSYLGKDRTAFQAGKIGLESFLVSGIVTQILKHTFGRERPSAATQSGGRWNGAFLFLNQGSSKRGSYARYDAFPSGHTATIFAAATTLSEIYNDSPWVSYASYSVASTVAVSRVMEQTHWLSDCFVGGLIGYFSTQLVIRFNRTDKPIVLLPSFDGQHAGLALNVGF